VSYAYFQNIVQEIKYGLAGLASDETNWGGSTAQTMSNIVIVRTESNKRKSRKPMMLNGFTEARPGSDSQPQPQLTIS
jgi:hypothetical protein